MQLISNSILQSALPLPNERPPFEFLTRSDTNKAVQLQKLTRKLKFPIKIEETLYYLWGKNKGTDQLCSYCTADLHLGFRLCRLLDFWCGHTNINLKSFNVSNPVCVGHRFSS